MYKLTKKFRFEAAHRLAKGYVGKCANIHGHSWNGELCLAVPDRDEQGIAFDYSLMKKFTKQVEDFFDHKIILCHTDTKLLRFCLANKWQVVVSQDNPTCETLAEWIYNMMCSELDLYCKTNLVGFKTSAWVHYIRIEETCTTSCTYYKNQ